MINDDWSALPPQNMPESSRLRFYYCGQKHLFKHAVPQALGGHGNQFSDLVTAHQQLGQQCVDSGLILSINAHLWGTIFPLIHYGSPLQQHTWLPHLLTGHTMGGHAITEPQAGSDIQALKTTATLTNKGFILNGAKRFITNSPIADILIIYAQLDHQLTAFLVQRTDKNITFTQDYPITACVSATMGELIFHHCLIPLDRKIGATGSGSFMMQQALELERSFIFAGLSGIMNWQLQTAVTYSRQRETKGEPLGRNQAISHKLAEMKLRLDTLYLWLNECVHLKTKQKRLTLASAQIKLYAAEAFLQSSLDAVHIMGAAGLVETHQMSALVHDALASRLFSGSSEIQKNIIAALLGTGDGYKRKEKT